MSRRSANGYQLSAAVASILILWQQADDKFPVGASMPVLNRRGPAAWYDTEEVRAEKVVRGLRGTSPKALPTMPEYDQAQWRIVSIKERKVKVVAAPRPRDRN
jgi:hypothetical protein